MQRNAMKVTSKAIEAIPTEDEEMEETVTFNCSRRQM
jgi:hypothetical protein